MITYFTIFPLFKICEEFDKNLCCGMNSSNVEGDVVYEKICQSKIHGSGMMGNEFLSWLLEAF